MDRSRGHLRKVVREYYAATTRLRQANAASNEQRQEAPLSDEVMEQRLGSSPPPANLGVDANDATATFESGRLSPPPTEVQYTEGELRDPRQFAPHPDGSDAQHELVAQATPPTTGDYNNANDNGQGDGAMVRAKTPHTESDPFGDINEPLTQPGSSVLASSGIIDAFLDDPPVPPSAAAPTDTMDANTSDEPASTTANPNVPATEEAPSVFPFSLPSVLPNPERSPSPGNILYFPSQQLPSFQDAELPLIDAEARNDCVPDLPIPDAILPPSLPQTSAVAPLFNHVRRPAPARDGFPFHTPDNDEVADAPRVSGKDGKARKPPAGSTRKRPATTLEPERGSAQGSCGAGPSRITGSSEGNSGNEAALAKPDHLFNDLEEMLQDAPVEDLTFEDSNLLDGIFDFEANDESSTPSGAAATGRRKPRTYQNKTPSMHCHICSRLATATQPHVDCGNAATGQCRKSICVKCFETFGWNLEEARSAPAWKCTHCRGECPSRAQCVIYGRTSERRRTNQIKHRKRPTKQVTQRAQSVGIANARTPRQFVLVPPIIPIPSVESSRPLVIREPNSQPARETRQPETSQCMGHAIAYMAAGASHEDEITAAPPATQAALPPQAPSSRGRGHIGFRTVKPHVQSRGSRAAPQPLNARNNAPAWESSPSTARPKKRPRQEGAAEEQSQRSAKLRAPQTRAASAASQAPQAGSLPLNIPPILGTDLPLTQQPQRAAPAVTQAENVAREQRQDGVPSVADSGALSEDGYLSSLRAIFFRGPSQAIGLAYRVFNDANASEFERKAATTFLQQVSTLFGSLPTPSIPPPAQ